jgi:hypothetical protein
VSELPFQQRVTLAIRVLEDLWPNHDGPAHIVLADFNVRDSDIEWCVAEIDKGETYTLDAERPAGHPVFAATRAVLAYLRGVPVEERLRWAEDPYAALYGDVRG